MSCLRQEQVVEASSTVLSRIIVEGLMMIDCQEDGSYHMYALIPVCVPVLVSGIRCMHVIPLHVRVAACEFSFEI